MGILREDSRATELEGYQEKIIPSPTPNHRFLAEEILDPKDKKEISVVDKRGTRMSSVWSERAQSSEKAHQRGGGNHYQEIETKEPHRYVNTRG